MKKLLLPLCCVLVMLSACTNADPKKMAGDVCDCMQPALKKLSSKAKKIVTKAFKSGDVQTAIQEEVQAIEDVEEQTKLNEEITAAGKLMQGKKWETCLEDVDKKYKVLKSQEKQKQNEVVSAMEDQCEVGAAIFRYGLKHKDDKPAADDEEITGDDETDKPKKKKTVEEEE